MSAESPSMRREEETPPVAIRGKLVRDEPLGRYTTFRIGGPAEWYGEPEDREDLSRLLAWARDRRTPVTILGGGSNLLISDRGLPGLVIRLARMKSLRIEDREVVAEAGLPLVSLLKRTADVGLSGLEGAVGVPGAVGGALVMNAGTPWGEFGDPLIEAEIMRPDGSLVWMNREDLELGYRSSGLKRRGDILISVRLRLNEEEPETVRGRMRDLDERRHRTQPLNLPSAGCIWKNPPSGSAGQLIDQAGCKGMREGFAEVSEIHANFIVNLGGAKAEEVIRLMKRIRERAEERFGVRLEPEVQLMGELDWER